MKELSLFDKFGILFDNILEHPLFIVLFFVPIVMFFLHKKHGKKIYVIMYFIAIFLVLIIGGNELFKIFDNFMDGLFMVLYFPNFITLFIVILLNALFAFVSIFSSDMHKVNKIINYVFFFIVQSLFILVVLVIRSNDLNIYKDNALYSNSDVLSLMQILIGSFGIQILSLLIINLIDRVTSILDKKEGSIDTQIQNLEGSKDKVVKDDIGYINVADRTKTSIPVLKPFKFDVDKLSSIKLDVETKPRVISPIKLKNKKVSYLDEIVKPRILKPIILDSSKFVRLEVSDNSRLKSVILNSNDVTYLNEVVKVRKFKPFKLDNIKEIYLSVPEKELRKITLDDRDISYLNEIVKDYKFVDIDSSKDVNLDVKVKPYKGVDIESNDFTYSNEIFNSKPVVNKKYKEINLESDNFSYLNEVPSKYKIYKFNFDNLINIENGKKIDKDYKVVNLKDDKSSNVSMDVKPKKYSFMSLKNKISSYLNEVVKTSKLKPVELDSKKIKSVEINGDIKNKPYNFVSLDSDKIVHLDSNSKFVSNNVKPDLMKPMDIKEVSEEVETLSIENLRIIDMQSMVDVISKYHFYKGVCLEGVSEDAVDNLEISNFELLMNVLNNYHLYKGE